MIIVNIDSTCVRCGGIWQYDYGQILRIQNLKLPPAVEIHFSLEERGGQSVTRIGATRDNVTDVVIPDSMLENGDITTDYKIYAFIYLTDSESGQTEYKISMSVKSRPRPESFERQEDAELFRTAIAEVNKSATSAQESATKSATAKDESIAAAKEAKQSAQEASTSAQEAQTSANESNELADIASSAAKASINAKEIAVSAANSADSNALAASRSAQEAKTSAEQADTAAKSANESKQAIVQLEQAIDSTAEQIATDRTAVEADKKEVQEAKSSVEDLKEAIEQKSSDAIKGISTAKDSVIKDVNTVKDSAVSAVTQEKESAVSSVNEAKDNVVAEINENENVQQIQKNKDEIEELNESITNSNLVHVIEKTITTTTDKWDNAISFRHVWLPFTAKEDYAIENVSFDALVNAGYVDDTTKFYCDLLKDDGNTVIASSSSDYEWVDNSIFSHFNFNLNVKVKKNESYYLHIYCLTRSFSYANTGYMNAYEDDFIYTSPAAKVSTMKDTTFENASTNDVIRLCVSMNISIKNITDISVIEGNIKNIQQDVDQLNDKKITKFYANSLGETHLEDSDNGKIQDLFLYGKSEQKQYTGKNLLKYPYDNTTKTANGVIFTDNGDGSVTIKGTATMNSYFSFHDNVDGRRLNLPTGTYKLIIKGIDKVKGLLISNSSSAENDRIFTVTDGNNEVWCFIEVPKDIAINETIYPMIQSTTYQNEDYEPYVGEIPSPNTEYPQEIRSVVNPVVKIHGKNLLDAKMINRTINGIEFVPRADGTLAINGTARANVTYTIVNNFALKAGTYSIKGCKAYYIAKNGKKGWFGTDKNTFTVTTFDSDVKLNVLVFIPTGTTVSEILKPMLVKGNIEREYEQYKEQVVNLPYTLNAIPVSSGGNIQIDDQQYIADYVDVERGVKVQMIKKWTCSTLYNNNVTHWYLSSTITDSALNNSGVKAKDGILCNGLPVVSQSQETDFDYPIVAPYGHSDKVEFRFMVLKSLYNTWEDFADAIKGCEFYYPLAAPIETKLTQEEIEAFKELATYYPVTNISVTSDQLDGYTTFNYPVSMKNGWDYVKQQLNDNRDYIYDMDAKTQDIDTQSAEAYVNSEYAVALTELEVM